MAQDGAVLDHRRWERVVGGGGGRGRGPLIFVVIDSARRMQSNVSFIG